MKSLLSILLLFLVMTSSVLADGRKPVRNRTKAKASKTFVLSSKNEKPRNNKATFRHDNRTPMLDLSTNNPDRYRTVPAPKPYRYPKGF